MAASPTRHSAGAALLQDFSLEITCQDLAALGEASTLLPPGTRVHVTFLAHEDAASRRAAAAGVRGLGLVPVPHVAARRLRSAEELDDLLAGLAVAGCADNLLVIAGDPAVPDGPFEDALAVIESGILERHGVRHVAISGYPEGHPAIADDVLWAAVTDKAAALRRRGLDGSVVTQFGFDADAVLTWLEEARDRGVDLPVRVGVPGPAGVKRLLGFATRFGVRTSTGIARKYGLSLANLAGTAGPDRFIRRFAEGYQPQRHGKVHLHFFTFGGLAATAGWVKDYRTSA